MPANIQSGIGGAVGGATIGGMIGGPPGAIIGGTLGLGAGLLGGGSGDQESNVSVKLENPNQTEQALAGQFGSMFQSHLSFEQFKEYFAPFLDGLATKPVKYGSATLTNAQDAYAVYNAQPSQFTAWVQKESRQAGTPLGDLPELQGPQFDVGQSVADYQNQVQGAADVYNKGALELWNDWMDFEGQYQDIYQAIGPAYNQIASQYQSNLDSIPKLNLGLPGGGSIPLAPKVHSNMYSQQAQTQAGIQGQKFGQQMQATAGQGQGIGNRQNLLSNYYTVNSDAAQSNLVPVELGKWLLQSERNLRAGAPQTQTSVSGQNNLGSTLLPALAVSAPYLSSAFNTVQNPYQLQQPGTTFYQTGTGYNTQPIIDAQLTRPQI